MNNKIGKHTRGLKHKINFYRNNFKNALNCNETVIIMPTRTTTTIITTRGDGASVVFVCYINIIYNTQVQHTDWHYNTEERTNSTAGFGNPKRMREDLKSRRPITGRFDPPRRLAVMAAGERLRTTPHDAAARISCCLLLIHHLYPD